MQELIYAGPKVEELIIKKYSEASIEDASDYIHTERFEVEIDGISQEEFYGFAKKNGFIGACFKFRLGVELKEQPK